MVPGMDVSPVVRSGNLQILASLETCGGPGRIGPPIVSVGEGLIGEGVGTAEQAVEVTKKLKTVNRTPKNFFIFPHSP
jgi:hypothetical protein